MALRGSFYPSSPDQADGPARGVQPAEVAGPLSPAPSAASEQVAGQDGPDDDRRQFLGQLYLLTVGR